jgi:hypothetical protein
MQKKRKIVKGYSHKNKKKRRGLEMWVSSTVQRKWPIVRVDPDVWAELMMMASYSSGEFTALLKIEEVKDSEFKATEWYLPEQVTSEGSAEITQAGGVQLIKDLGDEMEHYYGCFHIHPGIGRTVPTMSWIDVATMWTWVKAAGRGVFIVSNESGYASAMFLEELPDGRALQTAMQVEIGWELPFDKKREMEKNFDERVLWTRTEKGFAQKSADWLENWDMEHIV